MVAAPDDPPCDDDESRDETDATSDRRVVVVAAAAGRIDAVLAAAGLASRAQVQRWIADGYVSLAAQPITKVSANVRRGAELLVQIPEAVPLEVLPEAIPLEVVFEDAAVIAINKPAGMVVHPSLGHSTGTLVNALLAHCRDLAGIGGVLRPGIVHRLDKDTTGVMIVAKHDAAHHALADLFATRTQLVREYVALVAPPPLVDTLTVATQYGRHPTDRKLFSSKVQGGKRAVTNITVLARQPVAALIACRLETGRTHQIRVHCADTGFPIVGDPTYGRIRDADVAAVGRTLARQALHARTLELPHPVTGVRLSLSAPPPLDFIAAAQALRLPLTSVGL